LVTARLLLTAPFAMGQASSLDRPLPAVRGEPPTAARAELGRQLFSDPILSRDGDMSCATCHRPDLAFTDGLPRALGRGRVELARNTPTILNAALRPRLFWDGRARDLESQALEVLLSPREMAADPEALIPRLQNHPEYGPRFETAFPAEKPGAAVSLETIARALAAFERTLVFSNSRYDRFVRGDRDALMTPERRGLNLFRSLKTRCFECHQPPTFASPVPGSIGLAPLTAGVDHDPLDSRPQLLEVPSLRNVALTAPYMHDGSLEDLESVIRFYADGGQRTRSQPFLDTRIRPFELDQSEMEDLVAFLGALTDTGPVARRPPRVRESAHANEVEEATASSDVPRPRSSPPR